LVKVVKHAHVNIDFEFFVFLKLVKIYNRKIRAAAIKIPCNW